MEEFCIRQILGFSFVFCFLHLHEFQALRSRLPARILLSVDLLLGSTSRFVLVLFLVLVLPKTSRDFEAAERAIAVHVLIAVVRFCYCC